MAVKLPLRFRIIHYLSKSDGGVTCDQLLDSLKSEYGDEGQFKPSTIENHLMSLRAVGIVEVDKVDLDDNDNLILWYKISDYGKSKLSYLPQGWK
jgi:DNA-binding transcriptional ArsR family regulator